ncbi:hypothetical protein BDF22DRAFT_696886 [Syncephalis plumigaleata]|nr:hypothetical protein BDF22DRAFT_696886 [Syncephalis plumigaleata]
MPQLDTIRRVTATASACPSSVATSADCLFTGAIYFFNGKSPSFVAVPQLGSHPCSATGEIVHSVEQWLGKLALTPLTESITTSSHLLSPSLASNTTLSSTDQLVWHANDSILKTPTSPRVAPQDTPALPTPQWLPSPLLPIKDAYPWHSTTNYNHGDSNHDASSSSSSSSSTSSSNDSIDTDTNNYDKVASKHDTPWTTMEVMSNPSWTATTNTATATTMLPEEMHHVSVLKLSLEEDNGEQQTHYRHQSELEEHTRQQPVVQSNGLIGVSIDLHIRPSEQLERSDNCAVETLKHEYSFVCESEIRVWPTLSWRVNQPHHHEEANNNNNNNNNDDDESTRHSMSCICTVHIHREV